MISILRLYCSLVQQALLFELYNINILYLYTHIFIIIVILNIDIYVKQSKKEELKRCGSNFVLPNIIIIIL